MKPGLRELINLFLAASLLLLVGCGEDQTTPEIPAELLQTETPRAGVDISSTDRFPETGVIYQWADGAETSSEFSDPEWSAEQAVGEPDSPGCGDYQFAWASAASDGIETLTVQFPVLVYPLEIVIHESFNPDQVVKVEVQDPERDGFYTVLQKNPTRIDRPCPYELVVPVEDIDFITNMVRITVDQSQLGLGWNEIDAVQLIGTMPEE